MFIFKNRLNLSDLLLGWFKNPVSSQTDKLMAGTKISGYLGLNHYKKAKKIKHFIHLRLAQRHQSLTCNFSVRHTLLVHVKFQI